jgi:hypothetical protein
MWTVRVALDLAGECRDEVGGNIAPDDGCSEKGMLSARNPVFINLSEHP